MKRRLLPFVVVGLVALGVGWWMLKPSPDSERALRDFAPAMFRSSSLGCAKIVNGTALLSADQAEGVMREVVRPMFVGVRLESVRTERQSEGHSSAQVIAKDADGTAYPFGLNAFELENGGAIPLFMLLLRCWQAPVLAKLTGPPKSEAAFDNAYLAGIRSAGPKLEKLGISEIFGPTGKYMTAKEIEDYYLRRIAASSAHETGDETH